MHIPLRSFVAAAMGLALLISPRIVAESPAFADVYDLVRSNLTAVTDAELNAAAVRGLLQQLPGRVLLVTNSAGTASDTNPPTALIARTDVFDQAQGYLRIGRVEPGLAAELEDSLRPMFGTNELEGLVIDLRFAGGEDYAEAARIADRFVDAAQPLMDWGVGPFTATAKTNAFPGPLVILVNRQTTGAAEALAAVLRQTQVGLVIGAATAGEAAIFRDFPLGTQHRLRVAVAPVRVADHHPLNHDGVQPDIAVAVPIEEEQAYLVDPYRATGRSRTGSGDFASRTPRLTEADLVRMRRSGAGPDDTSAPPAIRVPEQPLVTDPVLARALDLLKGLAVVQPARQP